MISVASTSTDEFFLKSLNFSGGECHPQLSCPAIPKTDIIYVTARLQSGQDIMELLNVTEILNWHYPHNYKELIMPYLPYARQDRRTRGEKGMSTAFSLKTFASIINPLKFDRILTYDVHSDVALAVIDRLEAVPVEQILDGFKPFREFSRGTTLIIPDAGASKRLRQVSSLFFQNKELTLSKKRDEATGKVMVEDISTPQSGEAFIVDDICDGGATFVESARILRNAGFTQVYLYVTHGIFSKGFQPLLEAGINKVFYTNSCGVIHPTVEGVTYVQDI